MDIEYIYTDVYYKGKRKDLDNYRNNYHLPQKDSSNWFHIS